MRTNHVKAMLRRGEPALGAWLGMGSVQVARLLAQQGFDWLVVDTEHGALSPHLMADMVATIADARTCAPFVRLPTNSVEWFKWALDAGAWGVVVPMVNTREEALQAVSWSKYPPAGSRSIGGAFAPYGFATADRNKYAEAANDEIMVIIQVESAAGVQNVEEILSVPGIDVAFVGPNDLHAQLGLPPSLDGREPEFVAALDRIKAVAQQHSIPLGIYSGTSESTRRRLAEGFQMITVVGDVAALIGGAKQELKRVRETLK